MAHQHYRSPFGDTTYTKVFVGGLAWETPTEVMRAYFEQFGEILEAVIINDKNTGKSKGYGFVTFQDPESARRACVDPNPVIDGRRANCNIASLGRPRPSPPRGRNQPGNLYQTGSGTGTVTAQGGGSPSYPSMLPLPPPPPPVIYPPYGYAAYPPDYGYQQTMYNPQFQQQYYNPAYGPPLGGGSPSSSAMVSPAPPPPYYYGSYSLQPPRGSFSISPVQQRFQGPSYLYYPPTQVSPTSSPAYSHPPPPPPPPPPLLQPPPRLQFTPSTGDSGNNPPQTSTEIEAGPTTPTSSTT